MSDPLRTATLRVKRSRDRVSARAALTVVHPPELAANFELSDEPVVLGRDPEGAPRVEAPTVSRKHFEIRWEPRFDCHVGRDAGSRNGSWVNRESAEGSLPLEDGAVLRLGDVLLVYERGEGLEVAEPGDVDPDAVPGQARRARLLRTQVALAAADPAPALVLGETGTGKELVSRELHRLSGRRGPWVPVNCAALSPQLVESQLFGHVKGAFTGASAASPGLFRSSEGGTIFLDEIGELPLSLQPKLLRTIQENEVQPVGEARTVSIDVRVVAATHQALAERVEAGEFRRDLYARLAMHELRVPALRERRVDLFDWIERLHARWKAQRPDAPIRPLRFEAGAAEALLCAEWLDNLRGLDRLVHRLAPKASAEPFTLDQLGLATPTPKPTPTSAQVAAKPPKPPKPTAEALKAKLAELDGSVRATAKHYARTRKQIYRWMDAYGIER